MSEIFIKYDEWSNMKTRNGLNVDEVLSAFQKCVRRGFEKQAVQLAHELYISSPHLEEKLWTRILVISVEDVGFGDTYAPVFVNSLYQMREKVSYANVDRAIYFVHATRYLCKAKKDRSSDDLKNIVLQESNHGIIPEIPDFAIDMHTAKGREMGRGVEHFVKYASKVNNELEGESEYKEELVRLMESLKGQEESDNAFEITFW